MTELAPVAATPEPDATSERRRSLAFFTLIIALVLEIVDMTIVNTALPSIQRSFSGSAAQAQWVVAGYSLSFAVLLILGGRLGDLFGYRAMFLLGVAGFTLASFLCGAAANADQLVAARLFQGVSGAIMAPQVLSLIQILYAPVERIGRLAWFGVIGGLSAIAGPILGGMLIALDLFGLGWRTVFLINVPIGLAAVAAALWLLPQTERHREGGLDFRGTLAFGGALAALLFPLVRGDQGGWGGDAWLCLAASLGLAVIGWFGLQRRAARGRATLFDPALLANRPFRHGLEVALGFAAANTGFLFIFALALQQRRGLDPFEAGLVHIPFSVGVMFGISFIGRRYLVRAGRKLLLGGIALLLLSCTSVLGALAADPAVSLAPLVPLLVAAGVGMGMVSGPMGPVVLARVERRHAGAASGLLKTVQQTGAAIGVAMLGSAYFAPGRGSAAGIYAGLLLDAVLLVVSAACVLRLPRELFPREETPSPNPDDAAGCAAERV